MCSHGRGRRELRSLSLSIGRALCCLHSGKVTTQCVWYPWCSCTVPKCLAHWAVQQKADAKVQLSFMQSPLSGTSHLRMPFQLHLLEQEASPHAWGVCFGEYSESVYYTSCSSDTQATALGVLPKMPAGTSALHNISGSSQQLVFSGFYWILTPVSTRGTT